MGAARVGECCLSPSLPLALDERADGLVGPQLLEQRDDGDQGDDGDGATTTTTATAAITTTTRRQRRQNDDTDDDGGDVDTTTALEKLQTFARRHLFVYRLISR